jgi:hypothetical protein
MRIGKVDLFADLSCQSKNVLRTILEKSRQQRFKFIYENEVAEFIIEELIFYRLAELKPKPKDTKNRIVIKLTQKGEKLAMLLIEIQKSNKNLLLHN